MKPRLIGVATAALGVCLAAAACSSSGTTTSAAANTHTAMPSHSAMPSDTTMAPSHNPVSGSPAAAPNGTGTIGASCAKLPAKGTGSVSGMASEPVATAVSHNPQLTDFSRAIDTAGLAHTLNTAKTITVFAPDNSALAALGAGNVKTLLGNKADLTKVIQYHVVTLHVTPANLAAGKPLPTQLGLPVHPAKSGDKYTVNNAEVACGNIATSNATLYIINKVLIPTT
jgi:uncharacterized surface protein with fasciclin (FAS1) repeats